VRIGAVNLAVGDIIGGDFFEVLFLAAADFFYRPGSIHHELDSDNLFAAALAILLTGVLLLGLSGASVTAAPGSASRARSCSPSMSAR
jgi:cation:H+ antiporter